MKNSLLNRLKNLVFLFVIPCLTFGQVPNLGVSSSFALFTAAGAFSNDGASLVMGDIGTNVGAYTGFPPGVVIGQVHIADAISAQAATDADMAYSALGMVTCGLVLGTPFGNGVILAPGVYCLGGASNMNGTLILDGQCNPDAVFIFKINGALSTNTLSSVVLINGASLCNIYWQVNGAVELGSGSVFRGTIVGNGAIDLLEGATLFGRGITRQGAISLHNNLVDIDMQPDASIITAGGATEFCTGGSVTLSGNCGGVWSNGATTPSITVNTSGSYSVTTSNSCSSATSNVIVVTASPLPVCTITGNLAICTGQSTQLCAPAGAATYLWNTGSITNCATVSAAGDYSVTVTSAAGCSSVCGVTVTMNPTPICTITGNLAICTGQSTQLCAPAGAASYIWNTGSITNCATVSAAGDYSVTVTSAAGCSSVCGVTVTMNPLPVCTITGNLAICTGQTTQLCAPAGAASYLWNTGSITNCATVSAAGDYSVTVTSAAGCSSVCGVTVTMNPTPICTITGNLAICTGQTTQLCAPAGAASYLWNTGSITNCATVSAAGDYSVTVTSAAGCSSICNATVVLNPIGNCSITGNLLLCETGQTTQLCVPSGATSYLWSNGAVTNCITVGAGSFSVTVTNSNGCSSICNATVVLNPIANCSITGNLLLCEVGQTTQLCVPSGATSYLWSNGAVTNCITVGAGTFSVTVTNSNGCSSICSATVVLNPIANCSITGNLLLCETGQTTQLCVPAGATSYLWNNGAVTNCITVGAGTFSVTVTNSNGCISICNATVVLNPIANCSITGNMLLCETGQTTQLCVPSGATSYLWSNGAVTNCINVGAGTFSVTVTNSNGCSSICNATVVLNPIANCSITGNLLLCETGQTTQLCVPPGATSYLWSNGAVTNCITVGAGTFSVTVTNSNGCSSICSATVVLNPIANCSITGNLLLCEVGQTTQLCVPAGATSYLWSNGAVTNCITAGAGTFSVTVTNSNGCSSICSATVVLNPIATCLITGNLLLCEVGQTTQLCVPSGATSYLWSNGVVTNCITVGAGTFSVTVTNSNGCISICNATVVLNPIANCLITGNLLLCEVGQTTQLCVPAGATSYLWSNGAVTNCVNVGAGTFSVTVTNSNGCSSICNATVVLNPIANCSITGNLLLCETGQTTQLCVPAGATSYLWSNGAVTNCITVGAGTFSVTVTNSNGCISICSATVVLNPISNCSITGNLLLCEVGQTTQLCVPSGAASYLWSNGAVTNCITVGAGTFSVTVTNSNGCSSICNATVVLNPIANCSITGNLLLCETGQTTQLCVPSGATSYLWSNGAVTNCITVGAGSFSVTVTNSNGCSSICSATVVLNPIGNCSITGNLLLCETGQTTQLCVPAGATSYLWSNGAVTNCITVGAGTFSVTVTNSNGCSSICSATVVLDPAPDCWIMGNTFICETGQTTELCVTEGATSYLWSNGAVTNCITVGAGTFSVTVTNANGCTNVCSETVLLALTPDCSITGNTFICEVGQTTQLCVPSGAASYLWSNGAVTNCITVGAGTFSVTVTNANGCTNVCSETVLLALTPVCSITGNTFICEVGQTTQLCVPSGAASYLWSNGAVTNCITVGAGTFSVTVTNANGCISICSETVVFTPLPCCIITGNCTLICGQPTTLCAPVGCDTYLWCTGATTSCIDVCVAGTYCVTMTNAAGCTTVCCTTVTSGVTYNCQITGNCIIPCTGQPVQLCAPAGCLSYWWSTGATTSCIFVNTPGYYCVTVTNANGCTSVGSQWVTSGATSNCEITGNCIIPCTGQPVQLCAPAGCLSYLWSTGATTNCILVNTAGYYCVTITNANGCTSVGSQWVTSGAVLNCEITGNYTISCDGQPTLLCAPPGCVSYLWSSGATTSCIIASLPGNYSVTVTNANGCSSFCEVTVTQAALPLSEITGAGSICAGTPTLLCGPVGCNAYLWSTGAITSCIIVSQPGSYSLTVTNASGCTNTSTRLIDAGLVPICAITGNLQPEQGQSTLLCASADMAAYLWNTGDTTRCITVDSSGYYAVTITNASGCTNVCNTQVAYLLDETSEWDIFPGDNGKILAQVYPNPFNNNATVEFKNTAANSHVVIDLYKITGSRITTLFDSDIEQNKLYKADISGENLSEGVYWCRIVNGAQVINKKIILIR